MQTSCCSSLTDFVSVILGWSYVVVSMNTQLASSNGLWRFRYVVIGQCFSNVASLFLSAANNFDPLNSRDISVGPRMRRFLVHIQFPFPSKSQCCN